MRFNGLTLRLFGLFFVVVGATSSPTIIWLCFAYSFSLLELMASGGLLLVNAFLACWDSSLTPTWLIWLDTTLPCWSSCVRLVIDSMVAD